MGKEKGDEVSHGYWRQNTRRYSVGCRYNVKPALMRPFPWLPLTRARPPPSLLCCSWSCVYLLRHPGLPSGSIWVPTWDLETASPEGKEELLSGWQHPRATLSTEKIKYLKRNLGKASCRNSSLFFTRNDHVSACNS